MSGMHIAGLASGMDVQGIIDQILTAETGKIEKVQFEKVELQADIAAWSDISGSMTTLTDAVDALRSSDLWGGMIATVSDPTVFSAIATSSALQTGYDVTVSQLAQAHSIASDQASDLTGNTDDDSSTDLVAAGVLTAGDTFDIEGQTITIAADESLASLAIQINSAAVSMADDDKVTATILDNHLVITRDNTGDTDVTLSESSGTSLGDLGVFLSASSTIKNEIQVSQDAEFTINGMDIKRSSNTGLTDVIAGVSLDLLGESNALNNLTLTVSRDVESISTAIDDFIAIYNTAIEKIETYTTIDLSDPKNPRVGPLQGELMANELLYKLRKLTMGQKSGFDATNAGYTYDGRDGIADSLVDIGIWTNSSVNEISVVDEDRLDYMLSNNFDKVEQLFRGVHSDVTGYENGVARDLYSYSYGMSTSMTGHISAHLFNLNDEVTANEAHMEKMYDDLDVYEETLWFKFGAMDSSIAKMQQELSWLTGQMGS